MAFCFPRILFRFGGLAVKSSYIWWLFIKQKIFILAQCPDLLPSHQSQQWGNQYLQNPQPGPKYVINNFVTLRLLF